MKTAEPPKIEDAWRQVRIAGAVDPYEMYIAVRPHRDLPGMYDFCFVQFKGREPYVTKNQIDITVPVRFLTEALEKLFPEGK